MGGLGLGLHARITPQVRGTFLDRFFIAAFTLYCLVCRLGDESRAYAGTSPSALDLAWLPFSRLHSREGLGREPAYLYLANVFGPHRNVTIRAAIAVIAPATAGFQCEP